jgi:hypothetical protein
MQSLAKNRTNVTERWAHALKEGKILIRELKLDFNEKATTSKVKKFYYKDLVKYAFIELAALIIITLPELFINNFITLFSKGVLYFFYAVVSGIAVLFLPKTYKAFKLYFKYGRKDKELKKIANALKAAMIEKQIIKSPRVEVVIEKQGQAQISCLLQGATVKESLLFIDFLEEIIAPVENPRYIISQSGWFRNLLGLSNYYTVPKLFAERRSDADVFFKNWKIRNSNSTLTFTRNPEGRKLLLKARFHYYQDDNSVSAKKALIWK